MRIIKGVECSIYVENNEIILTLNTSNDKYIDNLPKIGKNLYVISSNNNLYNNLIYSSRVKNMIGYDYKWISSVEPGTSILWYYVYNELVGYKLTEGEIIDKFVNIRNLKKFIKTNVKHKEKNVVKRVLKRWLCLS